MAHELNRTGRPAVRDCSVNSPAGNVVFRSRVQFSSLHFTWQLMRCERGLSPRLQDEIHALRKCSATFYISVRILIFTTPVQAHSQGPTGHFDRKNSVNNNNMPCRNTHASPTLRRRG